MRVQRARRGGDAMRDATRDRGGGALRAVPNALEERRRVAMRDLEESIALPLRLSLCYELRRKCIVPM